MVGPVHKETTILEGGACAALTELMQLLLSTLAGHTRDMRTVRFNQCVSHTANTSTTALLFLIAIYQR